VRKATILLVEDNADMRQAVASYLRDEGFVALEHDSAESATESSDWEECDLAVLDIALPGKSGIELTRQLKALGFDKPILGLTARDTVDDKIEGLSSGMTDYVVKPFDLRELTARIHALLRIHGTQSDMATVKTTQFKIEPKRHRFYQNGQEIKLTAVEFRLMLLLMQHNHVTVSAQDLIEAAWGEDAALTTPPLRIHLSNLRSKIGDDTLTIIHTVPGIGYMLQD
jgi:DNA-binding response OmpR family regulator